MRFGIGKSGVALVGGLVLGHASPAEAQNAKPIVAVESVQGPMGNQVPTLRTMIESAILATDRFTVMDSTQYDALRAGQERCASGMVTARDGKCQRGQFVDPDYRIAATVTAAGITFEDNVLLLECHSAQAYVSIDIRITDKSTGQIKSSGQIDIKGKEKSNCGKNSSRPDASIDEVVRPAADAIAAKLVFASFPVEVLAMQGPTRMVLSYGQDVLKLGAKYDVFAPSQTVKDSRGNSYVVDNKVGTIEIVSASPSTSIADMICTVGGATAQVGYTARPAANPKAKRVKPAKGQTLPGAC